MMAEKIVYTLDEVAELLSISKSTIYTMVREGDFQAVKIRGGIRILKTSFDDYISKNIVNKKAA